MGEVEANGAGFGRMPAVRAEGAGRDKDGPRRERRREASEEGRVRPGRGRGRPGDGTWSGRRDRTDRRALSLISCTF